jgi:hypothetical protein
MASVRNPSLYQINTRVWLREQVGPAQPLPLLNAFTDAYLDELAERGFDWVWLLGVWQTGPAGRAVSRGDPQWRQEFAATLPDLSETDITGSPFAIQAYTVHADFGGAEALARLRDRLRPRGLNLLLDFVPNHTAPDHPWVRQHPEYYIAGDEGLLAREPHNYLRVDTEQGPRILAHGRDPYFSGWPDTLQLNYRCLALRQAMTAELRRIAGQCDAVRCDMAMLVLPDVIQRTWGDRSRPADGTAPIDESFWPEAIRAVRSAHPGFLFMAEVYWDLEWTLQQQGFDYTYDKRLYDRLHGRDAAGVRGHLCADAEFQHRSVRFLENHDEARAAAAFPYGEHRAAAAITYLVPGLRFFHEGQLEGRRLRVSMHLGRRPTEPADAALIEFYGRLLDCLKSATVRDGEWQLLDCRPAWDGNSTWQHFVAFSWEGAQQSRVLVAVNYAETQGQCYVHLPWPDLPNRSIVLRDQLSPAIYERSGSDLAAGGLFLDIAPWHAHVFDVLAT